MYEIKIPIPFIYLNIITGIIVVVIGFIFENLGWGTLDMLPLMLDVPKFFVIYGRYIIIVSSILFFINIVINLYNTDNCFCIFYFSIMPMIIVSLIHIVLSIVVKQLLFILPIVSICFVILLEYKYLFRRKMCYVSSRVL